MNEKIKRKMGRPKGHKLSEETKQKIRAAKLGEKHPLFGTHRPPEVKEQISKKLVGKEFSEETREKISKAKKHPFRNLELLNELVRDYADNPEGIEFIINNIGEILSWDDVKPETELLACSLREYSLDLEAIKTILYNVYEDELISKIDE